MTLVIKAELARLAKCSRPIPGDWVKKGKLDMVDGSDLIDTEAPKTKEFFRAMAIKNGKAALEKGITPSEITYPSEQNADSEQSQTATTESVEDYAKEKTRVAKETAIKLKLANAQTRGQLMQDSLVEEYLFLYLDKLHSTLDRMGSAALTDIGRKILTAGDIKPEHRLAWKDMVKGVVHGAKLEIMERLDDVKTLQAGAK